MTTNQFDPSDLIDEFEAGGGRLWVNGDDLEGESATWIAASLYERIALVHNAVMVELLARQDPQLRKLVDEYGHHRFVAGDFGEELP